MIAGAFAAVVSLALFASGNTPVLGLTTPGVALLVAPAVKPVVDVVRFTPTALTDATDVVLFSGALAVAAGIVLGFVGIFDTPAVLFAVLGT